jgi:hypothetical protein
VKFAELVTLMVEADLENVVRALQGGRNALRKMLAGTA